MCGTAEGDDASVCRCRKDGYYDKSIYGSGCSLPDIRPGFCFLENVQSAKEPSCNCYSDTYFSAEHGMFYSSKACDPKEKPWSKGRDCSKPRETKRTTTTTTTNAPEEENEA